MNRNIRRHRTPKARKTAVVGFCLLFSLLMTAPSVLSQNGTDNSAKEHPQLDELLDTLADRADRFEHSLPDFVATETLTQEVCKSDGKTIDRTVTVSLLTG